jgi:hypothetical protein
VEVGSFVFNMMCWRERNARSFDNRETAML